MFFSIFSVLILDRFENLVVCFCHFYLVVFFFFFFSVNVYFISGNDIFMVLVYVLLLFNDKFGTALHTSAEICDSYHRKSYLWH